MLRLDYWSILFVMSQTLFVNSTWRGCALVFKAYIFHYISLHMKGDEIWGQVSFPHASFLSHSESFLYLKTHLLFSLSIFFCHGCLSFSQNLSENICPAIECQHCSPLAQHWRRAIYSPGLHFKYYLHLEMREMASVTSKVVVNQMRWPVKSPYLLPEISWVFTVVISCVLPVIWR